MLLPWGDWGDWGIEIFSHNLLIVNKIPQYPNITISHTE